MNATFRPILLTVSFVLLSAALLVPQARATILSGSLADAANYGVLYTGTGGHKLQITNVTINGNVGVGGTGVVEFKGPGTINGRTDFSAANTKQFHNNNASNVGPTSVNFNQSNVSTDLTKLNALSSQLGAEAATNLIINNANQTININTGTLDASGNFVFQVTSYQKGDGDMLTIVGDGVHSVVFDFANGLNLRGNVTLGGGLTPDMVVWNFGGTGKVQLDTNASSLPSLAFRGIILAPSNSISLVDANLDGRVFGGGNKDMQIASGSTILRQQQLDVLRDNPPNKVPEPTTLVLVCIGLLGIMRLHVKKVRHEKHV